LITKSTTLKFFSRDSALNSEALKSVVYTISDTSPPVTTASRSGGTYTTPQTVTLTVNEPATIYYTVDGSEPTTDSPVYGPIHISRSTTLKFFARDIAGNIETIKSETYTIIAAPLGLSQVAAGNVHTVALQNDGTVWAWGSNGLGQLGDGSKTPRTTPVQVTGLTGITAIAAGSAHTIALKNDGTVWAWGENSKGELGDGTTSGNPIDRTTPEQVVGLNHIINISAGFLYTLALKDDGTVWAWGANWYGQLGNGTNINQYTTSPNMVIGLTGVTAIAAGYAHAVALKNDGTVWAWGLNSFSPDALGDGTPVQVTGLTGVTAVAAHRLNVARKDDGTVWTWGSNEYGELGLGDSGWSTSRTTPNQGPTSPALSPSL